MCTRVAEQHFICTATDALFCACLDGKDITVAHSAAGAGLKESDIAAQGWPLLKLLAGAA